MKNWLSLNEVHRILKKELGIDDIRTVRRFIDTKGEPRLRASFYGDGFAKRYKIKSEWVTEFIAKFEDN